MSMYRQRTAWWAWDRDAALVPGTYLDAVAEAGGQPVLIPPAVPPPPVRPGAPAVPGPSRAPDRSGRPLERLVGALDGLVLIGGGDLDAAHYGQPADQRNGGVSRPRDELEFGLLAEALARDIPVLAVCRGMQVLNVFLGGDLLQQLPDAVGSTRHQPRPGAFGTVTVETAEHSTVRRLLGERFDVLCSHHQAIGSLGENLAVTARSPDGVVEAVELAGHRFVMGVQWHPEEGRDPRLFDGLVAAAVDGSGSGRSRPARSGVVAPP
jgi:gamma-glutamyl-gamma-aminobutyrate hydrolase PuuD